MGRSDVAACRIEGVRAVIEAIRAGRRRVLRVALPALPRSPGARELAELIHERGIPTALNRDEAVWAEAEPLPEEPFEALLEAQGRRRLVALDGVTDVGNLGSIARSAEAAGASGLVLETRHAPPIGAGALRASAGALEYLRVGRAPSLPRAIDLCVAEGLAILAADPAGDPISAVPDAVLAGEWVWLFGSEDKGVRPGVRARAKWRVGIPQRGRIASLGVAAAAAYLLLRTAERAEPAVRASNP
jgi:23S rRNA (guanosine2251-2'-O)-methyltransferase